MLKSRAPGKRVPAWRPSLHRGRQHRRSLPSIRKGFFALDGCLPRLRYANAQPVSYGRSPLAHPRVIRDSSSTLICKGGGLIIPAHAPFAPMEKRVVAISCKLGVTIAQIIFIGIALSKMLDLFWRNFKSRSEHEAERRRAHGKRRS